MNSSHIYWPLQQKMAITLAYDDALNSQLVNALPLLNQHGIHATFYLPTDAESVRNTPYLWQQASQQGHELGNHTVHHCCLASLPNREWVSPSQDLDQYSLPQIVDEVLEANIILQQIDGQTERTFNPPCGDTLINGENYLPLIADQFIAIRGAEHLPDNFIRYVMPFEQQHAVDLIELLLDAERAGVQYLNFVFHGVGNDYLSVSVKAHQDLLSYLSARREQYWLDSYINIMRYLQTVDFTRVIAQ